MSNDSFVSWDEDKSYSLTSGGLIYTILKKFKLLRDENSNLVKPALSLSLIAWLPLLILTIIEGTFWGETVNIFFYEDFVAHIRLLIVLPFLVLIEKLIDPIFDNYLNSTRRLISDKEKTLFEDITDKIGILSNSWIPEMILITLIYGLFLLNLPDIELTQSRWSLDEGGESIDIAGAYYLFISIPLYQFLAARWIWRWIVWGYSIMKLSRLNLKVEASHADQMAGLEYMSLVPMTFCVLSLAFAAMFSVLIGESIIYGSAQLKDYYYSILFFVVSIPTILHMPMLFVSPVMLKAKARAMNKFSSLIQYHNNLYIEKWMEGELPEDENILGSMDNSSMADINGSYQQAVKSMQAIPVDRNTFLSMILLLAIPFIPLMFTIYSLKDLVNHLIKIVSG